MSIVFMLWMFLGIFLFIIAVGVGIFVYYVRVYKYRIELFENTGGRGFERIAVYKARKVRKGKIGHELLWVPKVKQFCSSYGRKMGKNTYWYVVAQDGYWYNCILGDLDAKMGMLDIEPVNPDVKAFYVSNDKEIDEMYSQPKNWPLIVMSFTIILALLIVFGAGWFILKEVKESQEIANANMEASTKATETASNILQGIDNLINGGKTSGITFVDPGNETT